MRQAQQPGLTCFEPQGAFYVFPSIEISGLSSEDFCRRLLEEQRVAVIPETRSATAAKGLSGAATRAPCATFQTLYSE